MIQWVSYIMFWFYLLRSENFASFHRFASISSSVFKAFKEKGLRYFSFLVKNKKKLYFFSKGVSYTHY